MRINIHPSEAISDNICGCCGMALDLDAETAFFTISLESVITRKTDCPPLHRACAVALAKSKATVHAIWESGYTFDGMPNPTFYLERAVETLEFDGEGDCTRGGISKALASKWLELRDDLGEEEITFSMGSEAKALLPEVKKLEVAA